MNIERGVCSSRVFQRERRHDAATVRAQGACREEGVVQIRINGGPARACGVAAGGRWQAAVSGLKTGGPYAIQFKIGREACAVDDVYVGDLWVLAGQSNMVGAGCYERPEPPDPHVRVYDKTGLWRLAADPLEARTRSPSIGPGMTFGRTLFGMTGVPVGLIPAARGASSMEEWDPDLILPKGEPLYRALLRRVAECGGRVCGILWYQGESDATPARAELYGRAFPALVRRMRRDFGARLPLIYVQIGRVLTFANDPNLAGHTAEAWDAIRERQRLLLPKLGRAEMTTAVDLELDNKIHLSSEAQKILGRRLALLAARLAYRVAGLAAGPRIIAVHPVEERGQPCLEVVCGGVNGRLRATGRPSGFTMCQADGAGNPVIKARLRGRCAIRLFLHEPVTRGVLWYGKGIDPSCNIEDERGLALPATGPLALPRPRRTSPAPA
jgi:hypothetical protein